MKTENKLVPIASWLLFVAVLVPPILVWGDTLSWDASKVGALKLFPLLGLLAFSIMWSHFAVGTIKRTWPEAYNYKKYFRFTSNVVLVLILLHPILLLHASYEGGFTAFDYVGPGKGVFILFAYFAIATFLLYEIVERLREKAFWKNNWDLVKAVNIVAFAAIYWHGLAVGSNLQDGWLRALWIFYGITALVFILHGYWHDFTQKDQNR